MCVLMKTRESHVMKMLPSPTRLPSSVTLLSGTTAPSGSGAPASDERDAELETCTDTHADRRTRAEQAVKQHTVRSVFLHNTHPYLRPHTGVPSYIVPSPQLQVSDAS